jgi:Uncharacterized homolog of phage Mu protein gp47
MSLQLQIKTFEKVMEDMLARIPDDLDKTQGSIIWDALAPAALEINAMYLKLGDVFRLAFIRTSVGEHLTELSFQFGVNRLFATKTIREAIFNINVAMGTRFSLADSDLNFVVKEKRGAVYHLECETAGSEANYAQGSLLPIDFISGLTNTMLGDIVILGEDEETDESLRERTITHITKPQQDGNIDQYLQWATEFTGIGNATVIPLWNGSNTVRVVITDVEGNTASSELVQNFQKFLDPGAEGKGEGKAPIGAIVTVASATAQHINITIKIALNVGHTLADAETAIKTVLEQYVKKATTQRSFKKYEAASIIDALKEVDYIVSFNGNDIVPLNASSIFTLGTLAVTK